MSLKSDVSSCRKLFIQLTSLSSRAYRQKLLPTTAIESRRALISALLRCILR